MSNDVSSDLAGPRHASPTQEWLTAHPEGPLLVLECGLCQAAVRVDLTMRSGSNLAVLFVDEHERAHSA